MFPESSRLFRYYVGEGDPRDVVAVAIVPFICGQ